MSTPRITLATLLERLSEQQQRLLQLEGDLRVQNAMIARELAHLRAAIEGEHDPAPESSQLTQYTDEREGHGQETDD